MPSRQVDSKVFFYCKAKLSNHFFASKSDNIASSVEACGFPKGFTLALWNRVPCSEISRCCDSLLFLYCFLQIDNHSLLFVISYCANSPVLGWQKQRSRISLEAVCLFKITLVTRPSSNFEGASTDHLFVETATVRKSLFFWSTRFGFHTLKAELSIDRYYLFAQAVLLREPLLFQ